MDVDIHDKTNEKKGLIEGVTDDTTLGMFIEKIKDIFNLMNCILFFDFPLRVHVRASIRDSILYFSDYEEFSVYSSCSSLKKYVSVEVHYLDEMIFDLTMKVNNEGVKT